MVEPALVRQRPLLEAELTAVSWQAGRSFTANLELFHFLLLKLVKWWFFQLKCGAVCPSALYQQVEGVMEASGPAALS